MSETRILDIERSSGDLVNARIKVADDDMCEVYFRCNESILSPDLDSIVCLSLFPSMSSKVSTIVAQGDISEKLLTSISTLQDIFCSWYPSLDRVRINGLTPVERQKQGTGRIGVFFSGGVDSFYTLLKHQDEITDLILVQGFDISLEQERLRDNVSKRLKNVARHFGKNLVEIETNSRNLLKGLDWGWLGHGAALASVGHLLSPGFSKIFISATHTYADLIPWGSHPLVDHLWSSESLEFVHDGCELTRFEKVARIAQCDVVLESLRVCYANPDQSYNCGRCDKCMRTMIQLEFNGALSRCNTFDKDLDLRALSRLVVTDDSARVFLHQNIQALKGNGKHDDIRKVLEKLYRGPGVRYKLEWRAKKLLKRFTIK